MGYSDRYSLVKKAAKINLDTNRGYIEFLKIAKGLLYRIGNSSPICPRIKLQGVPGDRLKLSSGTL